MKRKNRSSMEARGIAPKHVNKKEVVYKLAEHHCCPACGEARGTEIIALRNGFKQCRTCNEYYVTGEKLEKRHDEEDLE